MSRNGLPYFPLDVDDYLEDPAVIGMSAEAEGCYIRLLCRSWKSKTPGVIPFALMPEMSGLHRVSNEDYERVRDELSMAFVVNDDVWTQKRMVTEWKRADVRYKALTAGARKTNAGRNITRLAHATRDAQRTPSDTPSERLPGTGVGVGVGVGSIETGVEVDSTVRVVTAPSPSRESASTPVASRPVSQPQRPAVNPDATERATCHACKDKFFRPIGSQRSVCPNCHEDGER